MNDPLANLDQMFRGLVDVAKVMAAYQRALIAEGFRPEEALRLTVAYRERFAWMRRLEPGDEVDVIDAFGRTLRMRALGPVRAGGDFAVVPITTPERWAGAPPADPSWPESTPWPAEDVYPAGKAPESPEGRV